VPALTGAVLTSGGRTVYLMSLRTLGELLPAMGDEAEGVRQGSEALFPAAGCTSSRGVGEAFPTQDEAFVLVDRCKLRW